MNRVATGLGGVAAALLAVGVVNGETPPPSGVSLDDAAPSAPSLQPGISAQDVARAARQPGGAAGVRFHSVRAGDTLSRIAETHGFTIEQIAIANGISPAGVLSPGDIIYLPEKLGAAPATPEAAPLRRPTARSSQHVIVPNDTLYSIGRRYGFTVEELTDANAITADTPLAIGDTLLLPTITGAIPTAGPSVRPASGDVSGAGDAVTEPQLRGTLTNPQDMQPAARAEAGAVAATGTDERPAQERSGLRRFSYDPDAPAAGSSSAATPDGLFDISLRGRVRAAYGYNDEDLQLADADLEPTVRVDLPGDWRFSVTGRFRADAEDNIEPGRPAQLTRSSANKRALLGDRAEIELREAYIQGDLLDIDWTIGKQQIVWGESDGFKVLDVVNPQSFREFILPEFDESRIPLWSARAEKVIGQTTFEGVVVFDNTYDELPEPGSVFEQSSPRFVPPVESLLTAVATAGVAAAPPGSPPAPPPGLVVRDPSRSGAADTVDYGGRIKTFYNGFDLSVLYLRHTADRPSLDLALANGTVFVTPVYDRVNLIGGSFANTVGDFTLRGEVGYTRDRRLLTEIEAADIDPTVFVAGGSLGGHVERNSISYVIGVDWYGLSNTVVSMQFFHDKIFDAPATLFHPGDDYTLTGYVRRTAMGDDLMFEIEGLINLVDDDALIRPLIQYDMNDHFAYYLSGDIFIGPADGVFGQFEPASRVTLGALVTF